MERRHISTYKLIKDYGFSNRTIYNLKHNISITMVTLGRLCEILNCTPDDIIKFTYTD
ncbi:MAG: helix-turn-helix transcriptional regulator [Solobacterium sp.]|nr:helix-turn-helix transcriptional regulator [Solobacterium sp.]